MSEEMIALLPCDVKLPPATTITAGCKLSTLIHALELRGMAMSAYNPNERLRDALEAIIALTDRPDISDGGKVIFIRRNAGSALSPLPQGDDRG